MGGKKEYELILEIGHKSSPLSKKLANGYTHKWTAFVRGANNSKIEHCIHHVIFRLHDSFENSTREISEPPYQVKETGYAGFEIPIEIYFKNRDKPNKIVFIHDLCLLTNKPNDNIRQEKVKFFNPDRVFEKCLIKSGAHLVSVTVKKERSDSPPAKKQKSSSLIPSKDMSKQPQPQSQQHQPQTQQQQQQQQPHNHHHHHHNHQKSSSHQNNHSSSNHHGSTKQQSSHNNHNDHRRDHNHHHNNNNNTNNNNNNHQQQPITNQQQQQLQQQQQQQQQVPPGQKPKGSSRDFIDLFGAPLVYNPNSKHPHKHHNNKHSKHDNNSSSKYDIRKDGTPTPPPPSVPTPTPVLAIQHQQPPPPPPPQQTHQPLPPPPLAIVPSTPASTPVAAPTPAAATPVIVTSVTKEDQYANDLQIIQTKISCLSDCDRLQKIVDIVEEAGEWFNLTSRKFEFDLKRLDRKTLSKIERCLH